MEAINFSDIDAFNIVMFNGYPYMLVPERINKDSLPEGYYSYCVRSTDYDLNKVATVEKSVWVNFCGTIIGNKELEFNTFNEDYGNIYHDTSKDETYKELMTNCQPFENDPKTEYENILKEMGVM